MSDRDNNHFYELKLSSQEQDFAFWGKWTLSPQSLRLNIDQYSPGGTDKQQILTLRQPYFDPKQVQAAFDSRVELTVKSPGVMTSKNLSLGSFNGRLQLTKSLQED